MLGNLRKSACVPPCLSGSCTFVTEYFSARPESYLLSLRDGAALRRGSIEYLVFATRTDQIPRDLFLLSSAEMRIQLAVWSTADTHAVHGYPQRLLYPGKKKKRMVLIMGLRRRTKFHVQFLLPTYDARHYDPESPRHYTLLYTSTLVHSNILWPHTSSATSRNTLFRVAVSRLAT